METLYIGYQDGLVRSSVVDGTISSSWVLREMPVAMIVADPCEPDHVYAATLGEGLWRSDDGGRRFARLTALPCDLVWCVAVSASDRQDCGGTVYAGSQMSALFRSTDAGVTFDELGSVQRIPSLSQWSFPAAPDTHHVHQIVLDHDDPAVIVFGVELGGVYRSSDAGTTWNLTAADPEPHTLRTHPTARGRMYESGGASYCESRDGGATWTRNLEGLPDDVRYFYSMAADAGNPDTVLISGAHHPFGGHGLIPDAPAWSSLYRRSGGPWQEVVHGLPSPDGTTMGTLAAAGPGVFYYVTEAGDVYRSHDGGRTFSPQVYSSEARGRVARSAFVLQGEPRPPVHVTPSEAELLRYAIQNFACPPQSQRRHVQLGMMPSRLSDLDRIAGNLTPLLEAGEFNAEQLAMIIALRDEVNRQAAASPDFTDAALSGPREFLFGTALENHDWDRIRNLARRAYASIYGSTSRSITLGAR